MISGTHSIVGVLLLTLGRVVVVFIFAFDRVYVVIGLAFDMVFDLITAFVVYSCWCVTFAIVIWVRFNSEIIFGFAVITLSSCMPPVIPGLPREEQDSRDWSGTACMDLAYEQSRSNSTGFVSNLYNGTRR